MISDPVDGSISGVYHATIFKLNVWLFLVRKDTKDDVSRLSKDLEVDVSCQIKKSKFEYPNIKIRWTIFLHGFRLASANEWLPIVKLQLYLKAVACW